MSVACSTSRISIVKMVIWLGEKSSEFSLSEGVILATRESMGVSGL